jgi:hypothetical protein
MGIDLGGVFTIAGVSGTQALKFAGASDVLTIDTTGRTYYPNQIGFITGLNIDVGWTAQTGGVWTVQNTFNNTTYNKGFGYAGGRFTAPVTGSYLFHWVGYQYKPTATVGNYIHPQFWVNGAGTPSSYRLKAFPTPTGYSFVGEIVDILYLNAGDYVELQIYTSGSGGISLYRYYTMFSGYLVG